jgi:uncharacterized protein
MLKRLLCLIAVLALWLPDMPRAEADGPDFFAVSGVASDDVLNIRSDPSAGAAKVGQIPPDANGLRNLGCEGGISFAEWEQATEEERAQATRKRWCRVEFNGVTGWVAGWFLTEGAAPGPSFDCSKAEGEVEQTICANPWLARQDRELTRLYDLAISGPNMSSARLSELKAYQRGWIKGRNDCWKASDVTDCVSASYALRIAEIRAGYADARSQDAQGNSMGPLAYACEGLDVLLSVTVVIADPSIIALLWRENVLTLTQASSASGARYESADEEAMLWMKGDEAMFSRTGQPDLTCKQEPTG